MPTKPKRKPAKAKVAPKLLSERAAWLKLAKLWDNPMGNLENAYIDMGDRRSFGLCGCIASFHFAAKRTSYATMWAMLDKVNEIMSETDNAYRWPTTRAGARQRAAFCRRMAKECSK